jgi:hypothetical protein
VLQLVFFQELWVNPNVADPHRGKAHRSASDVTAHRRGQDEAYLTVREILSEASTAADGVLWCERSGFGWFGFAPLGLRKDLQLSLLFRNLSPEFLIKLVRRRVSLLIPCSIGSLVHRCSILITLDLYWPSSGRNFASAI